MAGTTLTALNGQNGVRLQSTAVIEGFPYIMTDGDPALALLAYSETNTVAFADFASAVGGLSVHWDFGEKVSPWKPMTAPGLLKFSVVPGGTDAGGGTISDIVGETVFKRVPTTETSITAAVDCNDTSVTTARADDFAAAGLMYLGPETMAYSSRNTGTDIFTISTRGAYPAVLTDTDARFARTHKPLTASEQDIGLPPRVTSSPTTWVGRWVSIWLHRNVGGTLDTVESDQSAAHLAFCGVIVGVEDVDGATVFECEDVRKKIYETQLNRDPFRARVQDGAWVASGIRFSVSTLRQVSGGGSTVGNGNDLVVVPSGAGANQINEGFYTVAELGAAIQAWLQGERFAARILFNVTYAALHPDSAGTRARMSFSDPTTTSGLIRSATVGFSSEYILNFMGWQGSEPTAGGVTATGSVVSGGPPLRMYFAGNSSGLVTIPLAEPRGTWVSQASLLPSALQDNTNGIDGILRAGSFGYLRAKRLSDTSFQVTAEGMAPFFPQGEWNVSGQWGVEVNVDDEGDFDVQQVLLLEAPFKTLLLQILFSTGTSGFNSATYDTLSEALGCGIPYSVLGDAFVEEVGDLACADTTLTALVDTPVAFHDLFSCDFILRRCFLAWGAGRLNVKSWATPTSTYATTTLTEAYKASPSGQADKNRAAVSEQANYYNVVTIHFNMNAAGEYADNLTLRDASSIREFGERAISLKARNTFRNTGAVGSPIDDLISQFSGFFGFTSRPWQVIRRTIDQNKFEQCIPGTVLSLTDNYVRSPATGKRYSNTLASGGLQGYPGMVVGLEYDWGGPESGRDGSPPTARAPSGQVDVMMSPGRTLAAYVPCAQVDDTQANAGYDAANTQVTTYAHEHSEASDATDASHFVATDVVTVVEIDPAVPGSPTTWTRTISAVTGNVIKFTAALSAPAWDAAKKYRVVFAAYGSATATQKAKSYQADDADQMIVDTAQPYGFGFFGSSQLHLQTASPATEVPARYSTSAYGDGVGLDVGYERDMARLVNNLVNIKTALQQPTQYTEVRDFVVSGASVRQLVELQPIFVGIGELTAGRTRLLSVSPRFRSTTGATATVRVTLSRRPPTGATEYDVVRVTPYVEASFSTTSTTFAIPAVQTLDISHLKLGEGLGGGIGYLYVELIAATEYTGMSRLVLGSVT